MSLSKGDILQANDMYQCKRKGASTSDPDSSDDDDDDDDDDSPRPGKGGKGGKPAAWAQVGGDKTRCKEGKGCPAGNVQDLAGCEAMAEQAGHEYIEYHEGRRCCNTLATCTTKPALAGPWKVYSTKADPDDSDGED